MARGIYVASRAKPGLAAMWRDFRAKGFPIISTWIDEAGEGETADFGELWGRIEREVKSAAALVVFVRAEDVPLKGALVEVGMALSAGLPVFAVIAGDLTLEPRTMRPVGSWLAHPLVTVWSDVASAILAATGRAGSPEIQIEELREAGEDGGDLLGYFCRFHVPPDAFAKAANHYTGAHSVYDLRYVTPQDVRHVWWRCVPLTGEDGGHTYIPANPGARGAWKATIADVVGRRNTRVVRQRIEAENRGHARGFAAGVDWAIRMLEMFGRHPQAAELLLNTYRNTGERAEKEAAEL